ncbi:MAG: hypothetical protein GX968_07730 [Tissierellia bacterium]|nr:hypothetical protein [Tissierellia bacterium]
MVKISKDRASIEAISGNVDKNALINNNYFVSGKLHGIDGISYMEKAEPISYEKLISMEGIPAFFKEFKLDFLVDGKIIETIDFNYGDSLSLIEFPEIPPKDGYYSRWEEVDMEDLIFDTEIHGEYIPYLTVLESKVKRDKVLSTILVEGLFTDEDTLNVEKVEDVEEFEIEKGTLLEQWAVNIPEDGANHRNIRYLPPNTKGKLQVYVLSNGKWTKTKSQWDGKY